MRKLLLAAAASLACLALPAAAPAEAQVRADGAWAAGANVQLAQWRGHRRFHRGERRDHRDWHRDAGRRSDWDRGDFRGHRRFHRDAFRGHRRFRGHGFGSGFAVAFGFGHGSGFGFGHSCRSWWWDGWAWRCRW